MYWRRDTCFICGGVVYNVTREHTKRLRAHTISWREHNKQQGVHIEALSNAHWTHELCRQSPISCQCCCCRCTKTSRQRTTPHFFGGRHDGTHRYLSQMQRSPAHSRYQTGCKVLRTWTYAPDRHVYGVASEARSRTDAGGERRCWVVVSRLYSFSSLFAFFVFRLVWFCKVGPRTVTFSRGPMITPPFTLFWLW